MKTVVTVPNSWDEVTVGQFQELQNLDTKSKDYSLNVASILLDKDPEEIRKYDVTSADKISRHLEWVMQMPSEDSYKQQIVVEGKTYTLIENLNKFSNGEWFDMEDYLEDKDTNLHYLFAMFYRLPGEEYSGSKCKERGRLFSEKVNIGDVYGCLVFFSNVAKRSMITTQVYLMDQISEKKIPMQPRKTLQRKSA
jgi:hypothetical protein